MKKLLALFLILGMNFAYAQSARLSPMPDSWFDSKKPNIILETSARCAVLFAVLSEEFNEPTLKDASKKFVYLANNLGFNKDYAEAVVVISANINAPIYSKEAKKEKSAVVQSDMWKCPYLIDRFNLHHIK